MTSRLMITTAACRLVAGTAACPVEFRPMDKILTLVADPRRADLDPSTVETARAALAGLGAETGHPDWLAPGIACDIGFAGLDGDQADAAVQAALPGRPVDWIAQEAEGRRKRLLVADMESTIIQQEMLDELADLVELKERIAAITYRAMNGELDFETALRERVALLAGLPVTALEECYGRITLMPGAEALVRTMKAHGARCALVSGGCFACHFVVRRNRSQISVVHYSRFSHCIYLLSISSIQFILKNSRKKLLVPLAWA